jgi:transposase
MRPPLQVRARGRQLRCLQQILRRSSCPRAHLRAQMVLLAHQGYSLRQIAALTRPSDETVRRWLHRFPQGGCPGLRERPRCGRPAQIPPAVEELLRQGALRAPRKFAVPRPRWTTANRARLVERLRGVRVTAEGIRPHVHGLDFVCRRPTWTVKHLARQQPGYAPNKGPFPGGGGTPRGVPTSPCRTRPN